MEIFGREKRLKIGELKWTEDHIEKCQLKHDDNGTAARHDNPAY